jgi:hypothetical protein
LFESVFETVLETLLETLLETNKTSSINFLLAPVAVGWCARERLLSILTEIASGNHPRAAMRAVARTLHSYVAISREYGFAGANLMSLLDLCGFDDIKLVEFGVIAPTWKQRLAQWVRWPPAETKSDSASIVWRESRRKIWRGTDCDGEARRLASIL